MRTLRQLYFRCISTIADGIAEANHSPRQASTGKNMLSLDPKLIFRKAKSNVFCYEVDAANANLKRQKILHPIEAMVLSLFDGTRSTDSVSDIVESEVSLDPYRCKTFVANLTKKYRDLLVEDKSVSRHSPADFAIPDSKVDMNSFRLEEPACCVLLTTYQCSSNCAYCYANKTSAEDADEMDFEKATHIVDQLAECDVSLLYLGGGDPFRKKWVFELIEYIFVQTKIQLALSTKEYLSEGECERLSASGVRWMQVSIDSIDDEVNLHLVGRREYSVSAFKTIENLLNAGIEVSTNTVVTGLNLRGVLELVKRLLLHGVSKITLSRYYRSTFRHVDSLFVSDEDTDRLRNELAPIAEQSAVEINLPTGSTQKLGDKEMLQAFLDRSACSFGRTGTVITPSGKVIPCEQLPSREPFVMGDLTREHMLSVWNSDKLLSMLYPRRERFRDTPCEECEYFIDCVHRKGLCVRDIYKVRGVAQATDPRCPVAKSQVRLL